jgi:hypothetical protein
VAGVGFGDGVSIALGVEHAMEVSER